MLCRCEHLIPRASLTRQFHLQRFPEESGESQLCKIHSSSQPGGQSIRVGLLLGRLSLRLGPGLIKLWLFHQLYSHWISRSSQLTFHKRLAVSLFRALEDTQVLLQSLGNRERPLTFRSENCLEKFMASFSKYISK